MIQIPLALQAYSLRGIFEKNPLEAMQIIKTAGYSGVEFYGAHFQPEFYAALLRETGLVCAGWHTMLDDLEQHFDAVLRRNLAVGNHFIAVPWFDADSISGWKAFAGRLNAMAEKLAPYGIHLGYHNHAHEFKSCEGEMPWHIIGDYTHRPIFLQLDTGNARHGDADVLAELEKYPWRNRTIHFKPYSKAAGFVPAIGDDDLDWEAILKHCETRGVTEWIIVEYEDAAHPVEAVERCAAYLKQLRPR